MTDKKYFGTDGIRGKANQHPITPERVLRLAQAAGTVVRKHEELHRVVIGKDTRLSGYMLEPALTSGFISTGMDVILVGPLPTPAISMLTTSLRADLGVMISASHNPYCDNGIKLFGADGMKLSDDEERRIEHLMDNESEIHYATHSKLGRASRLDDAQGRYIEFIKSTFPNNLRLDGLKLVMDCAHGAAYKVAPTVLYELGAEVIEIGCSPDGMNINNGYGAIHTENLQKAVKKNKADLGIALDGDADRLILCSKDGNIIDGDKILAIIATYYKKKNKISNGVVSTIMSNMGLEIYLKSINLSLTRTAVGDKNVMQEMMQQKCNLGGEQSGHIIIGDHGYRGDGLLAALQILAAIVEDENLLNNMHNIFPTMPQTLVSIKYGKTNPLQNPLVQSHIQKSEKRLGNNSRLIVRRSGTEPLIRLMAECEDEALMHDVLGELKADIEKYL